MHKVWAYMCMCVHVIPAFLVASDLDKLSAGCDLPAQPYLAAFSKAPPGPLGLFLFFVQAQSPVQGYQTCAQDPVCAPDPLSLGPLPLPGLSIFFALLPRFSRSAASSWPEVWPGPPDVVPRALSGRGRSPAWTAAGRPRGLIPSHPPCMAARRARGSHTGFSS